MGVVKFYKFQRFLKKIPVSNRYLLTKGCQQAYVCIIILNPKKMAYPNPFELIDARLSDIERLLIDIKHRPHDDVTNDFLTISEAARFLELSKSTLNNKVSRAEIPVMKRSGKVYFYRQDLIEYLKSGRRKTIDQTEK